MVKIVTSMATNNKNHFSGVNPCDWITVHETGNTGVGANAMAHANNMRNNNPAETFHYAVDSKHAVHMMPDNIPCWHAGDGQGNGNMKSIGIETCVNSDGDYKKAVQNCAELVAILMKRHNIPISRVVQHNYWSGKNCPSGMRSGRDGMTWSKFISLVKEAYDGTTTVTAPVTETKPTTPTSKPVSKTIDQLADEVIAGKHGTGDARKKALGSQYDAVQNRVNEKLGATVKPKAPAAKKSNDTVAQEVINGQWGNGADRTNRLRRAGYNPTTIQNLVNQKLGVKTASKPKTNKKTNAQIAREIYNGVGNWGNGQTRIDRLRKAGYDPVAVQREVNKLF